MGKRKELKVVESNLVNVVGAESKEAKKISIRKVQCSMAICVCT